MATEPWALLEDLEAERCILWAHRPSGLRAVLVIDDVTLGPGAGGIRTRPYRDFESALSDAAALARAMTLKCALAGIEAGGAKAVVLDHPELDREQAFAQLGRLIEELGGLFRTAGDLGTRREDLLTVAEHTQYVHTEEGDLARAVARGVVRCIEACVAVRDGGKSVAGLRVAVQGAGAIGGAVARTLAGAGASIVLSDLDTDRALEIAEQIDATVLPADSLLSADVDVLAPCAVGGVIDEDAAASVRAWAVCGAANNIVTTPAAARALADRGILHVPDVIASAGAVIDGIGRSVMGLGDRTPLIDRLGETAREVLERAGADGLTPSAVAERIARERIAAAR